MLSVKSEKLFLVLVLHGAHIDIRMTPVFCKRQRFLTSLNEVGLGRKLKAFLIYRIVLPSFLVVVHLDFRVVFFNGPCRPWSSCRNQVFIIEFRVVNNFLHALDGQTLIVCANVLDERLKLQRI